MDLLRPLTIGGHRLDNNLVLSPMAGYSDIALRALCRTYGAGLVSTEMVAAPSANHANHAAVRRMTTRPEERPVMVQVIGREEDEVAAAARTVEPHADFVGFNLGCPAHQVLATGCGAELLNRPAHAARLVKALADATDRPIIVKLRAGTDHVIDLKAIGQDLVAAGADALILHARTAVQGYSGNADWSLIRRLKDAVDVPVIGNGDVRDGAAAMRLLAETGADGVAIGRAALGDPRVFARVKAHLESGEEPPRATPAERVADFEEYTRFALRYGIPLQQMRSQAVRFAQGFPGARRAREALNRAATPDALLKALRAAVRGPAVPVEH